MKKFIFLAAAWFFCQQSFAQIATTDSLPVYKQFPTIPVFTINTAPDSTAFTKADLKKKEPLVLILFSPDCEHCQRETDSLEKYIGLFKDVQIVMATPLDYIHVKNFYKKYKIADYPNITVGQDPVWYLGGFYKVRNFPTIIVYDRKGEFTQIFEGSIAIKKVAAVL